MVARAKRFDLVIDSKKFQELHAELASCNQRFLLSPSCQGLVLGKRSCPLLPLIGGTDTHKLRSESLRAQSQICIQSTINCVQIIHRVLIFTVFA